MTIGKVIRLADALKPNAIGREQKYQYINEIEGLVQSEVMLLVSDDIVTYDCDATGADDTVLLVKPPHDKLYIAYLVAMIDYANGEYNKYANTIEQFNTYYAEYHRWYFKHFHPADGECVERGYYLSAYTLAVLHGFEGDEDAFVASMVGKSPEMRYTADGKKLEWKYTDEGDDAWRELIDLGTVTAVRDEAVSAAVTAEENAAIAQQAVTDAQNYANQAEDFKNRANQNANYALEANSSAYQHAQNAKSYAEQAKESSTLGMTAAKVGDYAKVAEVDENGVPTRFEAAEGLGGSFVVTLTKTDSVYSADRTFAEITTAFENGLTVIVRYGAFVYNLIIKSEDVAYFSLLSTFEQGSAILMLQCNSNDVWSAAETFIEQTANRVTQVTSASTDTEYPSAKAAYTLAANSKTIIVKVTQGSTITADKTFAQISTAINSGRLVAVLYSNCVMTPISYYNSSTQEISFAALSPATGYTLLKKLKCTSANEWTYSEYSLEHRNNLVTSIGAGSGNTQYPSAKAVYDAIKAAKLDIIDENLTEAGKAADAAIVGERFSQLSEEKVSLPKAEDGSAIQGTAGWYAVSDGAGGITWVESAPSTGGGGETTTHGIVWDLTNVTSSNNVVSVSDGASLIAVLTPADGYTLGDVTITMGGEVVTGAWNADTATVTIQIVTGDVMISCAGVEQTDPVDTSPVIAQSDVGYNASGVVTSFPGVAITKPYEFTPDIDGIKASSYYDETNDYTTTLGASGAVAVYTPNTKMVEAGYSTTGITSKASKTVLFRDGVVAATMSNACLTGNNTQVILQFARQNTDAMYANSIAFTISELDADDSYAYWTANSYTVLPVGVREGDIIFAGKNTPYYGMINIDGTMPGGEAATALSLDDDIAQDYGVATLSLTPDLSADTSTTYGLASAYASVLETIRNEWMIEYNGNANKIPIIIHTDQHGRMTNGGNVKGLFNTIGKAFSLHDISKVMNLGDTVSVEWKDADAGHPLLSCMALENYLSTVEAIPFSKRLEVFGNHDTWYYNGYNDEGNAVGTRYPSTQNHLYKYFRNIYKKSNGNNTGYFAVCDDYFNVKYVVVSAYEYQNGTISDRMTSEQIEWIIREFSKDDGYDIVVVSHCPLYWDDVTGTFPEGAPTTTETLRIADDWIDALWAGRKNKTSGTVNDSDGGSHTFDFTGCTSNLLCALHGHTHRAGYNYVGDSLLSVAFDWFANESMYFCLIDRENRELKVWKFIGSDGDAPEYLTWTAPFNKQ